MSESTPPAAPDRADEKESIKAELVDEGSSADPVSLVKNAQIKSLADAYRFQAEVLDELRGQLQSHKEANDTLKQRLEELGVSVSEWKAFQQQERERIETSKPPIEDTPISSRRPFGGPGF